jgi:hypothetical protein
MTIFSELQHKRQEGRSGMVGIFGSGCVLMRRRSAFQQALGPTIFNPYDVRGNLGKRSF